MSSLAEREAGLRGIKQFKYKQIMHNLLESGVFSHRATHIMDVCMGVDRRKCY